MKKTLIVYDHKTNTKVYNQDIDYNTLLWAFKYYFLKQRSGDNFRVYLYIRNICLSKIVDKWTEEVMMEKI